MSLFIISKRENICVVLRAKKFGNELGFISRVLAENNHIKSFFNLNRNDFFTF